jgi:hypothetical protein
MQEADAYYYGADGYYGDYDSGEEELDLSFLDEDDKEDEKK